MTVPARTRIRDEIGRERRRIAREHPDPSDPASIHARSLRVVANLRAWLAEAEAGRRWMDSLHNRVIASYRVLPANAVGEVDLSTLVFAPELSSVAFAYPRIVDRFLRTMDFAVPFHETDWAFGPHGIPEPRHELPAVPVPEIEAFLLPGVAFGRKGERLGRGAGYYDRFLSAAPKALRIGVGFDFQLVEEEIPQEPWDERLDLLVTEAGVVELGERA
jgi:5-formyltetrahydrofolate cyclo-ligase